MQGVGRIECHAMTGISLSLSGFQNTMLTLRIVVYAARLERKRLTLEI